jgi:hypothetical protein
VRAAIEEKKAEAHSPRENFGISDANLKPAGSRAGVERYKVKREGNCLTDSVKQHYAACMPVKLFSRFVSPPDSKILFPNAEQTTEVPPRKPSSSSCFVSHESKKYSVIVVSIRMIQARFSQIFRAF